jgi:hypothetical protein
VKLVVRSHDEKVLCDTTEDFDMYEATEGITIAQTTPKK